VTKGVGGTRWTSRCGDGDVCCDAEEAGTVDRRPPPGGGGGYIKDDGNGTVPDWGLNNLLVVNR
jgi:hypothetical protein